MVPRPPTLPLTRWFGLLTLVADAIGILLAGLYGVGWLAVAWVPLFSVIFVSAGWFAPQIDAHLGWPSFFIFLFSFLASAAVARPFAVFGFLGFFLGLFSSMVAEKRAPMAKVGTATPPKVLFSALAAYGVLLLGATFYVDSVSPFLLAPAVPLGLLGWFSPEISRRVKRGRSQGNLRGLVLYIAVAISGIGIVFVLGSSARLGLLAWEISLVLFLLCRAAFLESKGMSSFDGRIDGRLQPSE